MLQTGQLALLFSFHLLSLPGHTDFFPHLPHLDNQVLHHKWPLMEYTVYHHKQGRHTLESNR